MNLIVIEQRASFCLNDDNENMLIMYSDEEPLQVKSVYMHFNETQ